MGQKLNLIRKINILQNFLEKLWCMQIRIKLTLWLQKMTKEIQIQNWKYATMWSVPSCVFYIPKQYTPSASNNIR